jgi:hypothetical protein
LLLANGDVVAGIVALVVGVPLLLLLARALYGLSRRWAVLVPAGFVVVDPMTLADPVLLLRERIRSITPLPPRSAPGDVLDLRLGATAGSIVIRFDEEAELFRATRRRRADTVRTPAVCVALVRRDALLRAAAARRLPVR